MPAADGGAVTTDRHQAQTTVKTRAGMATFSSLHSPLGTPAKEATEVPVQQAVSVRRGRTLWTSPCSVLDRGRAKTVRAHFVSS